MVETWCGVSGTAYITIARCVLLTSPVRVQVYIRSFADSNADGTGDIQGLRNRLPYLKELGVDAIWVNPWYKSPLADGGYDVEDYRQIEPMYGNMDLAETLIKDCHDLGLKLIPDLVRSLISQLNSSVPWNRIMLTRFSLERFRTIPVWNINGSVTL